MSVPAARIRTSSGWRDIAIQGAPGPAGKLLSAKATSPITYAAADTYYRGITCAFTPVFDDFGNSFSPNNVFTCRQAGRYLVGCHVSAPSVAGTVGVALWTRDWSGPITIGADARKYGTGIWQLGNLNVNDAIGCAGFHSGGGSATYTIEVIQLAGASGAPPGSPIVVTALPINPTDGTEVYFLADATNGVVWHLRYRAAASGSFKWEFLGGSPLIVSASNSLNSAGGAAPFASPVLTYPLAGDYRVGGSVFAAFTPNVAVGMQWAALLVEGTYGSGGSAYGLEWQANFNLYTTANQSYANRLVIPEMIKTGLAAGAQAKLLPTVSGYDYNALHREIRATPVRVG